MKKLLLSLPLVMSLVACSDKEDTRVINGISQEITVDASTRMMYGNKALKTGTTFDVGDQISVYVAAGSMDNVEMGTLQVNNSINTLGDDGWTADPKMLWKDRTTKHYFLGVYPQRQIQDLYAESYAFDIADQEASDLLVATNTDGLTCTATPVPLTFHHVMSRLDVYLKFVDFSSVPTDVAVKVDLYDDASVNLATREVTPSTTKQEYTLPVSPVLKEGYDLGYRSIAVPCNDLCKVTVEVDGQTYVYTPKNPVLLAPGMTTSFMLTVSQSGISISDVNIVDWDSGEVVEGEITEGEPSVGNKETRGFENGHEWVDLGLSVKWATMNVGATAPQEYGSYIAWGETETTTKSSYDWDTYKFKAEFIGDNKTTLDKADDAAAANWGGDWVMPSPDDFDELQQHCTYEWTKQNRMDGYKFTGSNGNSIFLPAAGSRDNGGLSGEGSYGYYWSSSLYENDSYRGGGLNFRNDGFNPWSDNGRYYGRSVRPVCPSAGDTNGHVAVDLGLPSGKLWAECNVGASTPEASGAYIAWGETSAKEYYDWSTYKHMQAGKLIHNFTNKYQAPDSEYGGIWYRFEKYSYDDNKTTLDKTDDAATANWGDNWRMPSTAEWEELFNNTTQTWTDDYEGTGIKGYILVSAMEGHEGASIFLPAADFRDYRFVYPDGVVASYGYYWSSSSTLLVEQLELSSYGRFLHFGKGFFNPSNNHWRCSGLSVRPVCSAE
ncbi:MAG: fimbrillin family protein [Bacteroidales bacterium]|nr:fimbrillin family protein [Bacteroidales bacterium]